jgi:eukaryotic-like serine/threonine-protein kinase
MPGGPNTRGAGADGTFVKGRRIDRYEIRGLIGQGGMGAVYRAVDTKLGRTVALKTVVAHRRAAMNEEVRQRFMREALAASKVDHRNVVHVLDFGFTEDGTPFIVMEYLRGDDLGARLRDSQQPLAVEFVADVMLGVCAALHACHGAGIIHRDLKPANIFLVETDTGHEVKVLDFGVSKAPLAGDLTEEGQILGTPQYLSPEQIEGRTVPESDQYALGMVLYVCLTKRLPYEDHQNLSLLKAIELGKFQPPRAHRPELPETLEAIILQALRIAPSERFASVHALGQRLWAFASARGREQWKNYYFSATPSRPAKESTIGIPLVAELARGTLKGPAGVPSPALASTERPAMPARGTPPAIAPTEAMVATPGYGSSSKPPVVGPQAFVSTKLALPQPPDDAGSLMDVTGESQLGDRSEAGGRALRRAAIGLLGVGALATLGFFVYRGKPGGGAGSETPSAITPQPAATASPAPPPPPPPRAPEPVAPAPSPPPTPPAASRAAPAPKPAPPARAADVDKSLLAKNKKDPAPKLPAAATPTKPKSGVEYTSDGVPIMP